MLQSSTTTIAPRAVPTARARTADLTTFVSLDVTVPSAQSSEARRALHAALGTDLRLYIVTTDKASDSVTFRVEVTSRTLKEVITALTHTLSNATLGHASMTMVRRPQGH